MCLVTVSGIHGFAGRKPPAEGFLTEAFPDGTSFAKRIFNRFWWGRMKNPGWVLVVLVLLVPQSFADSPVSVDAQGFVSFRTIDSDHNGYVSRVEARSVVLVENAFDSADANRDGLLDRDEYTSVRSVGEAK